jgi:hypothetical protein
MVTSQYHHHHNQKYQWAFGNGKTSFLFKCLAAKQNVWGLFNKKYKYSCISNIKYVLLLMIYFWYSECKNTVNSEIIACIYYCDSSTADKNVRFNYCDAPR